MAITNYEYKYSITITFKEGYGDPIEVEGAQAEAIYGKFANYIHTGKPYGFELKADDGSACIYLFCAVAKICRTKITKTETKQGKCKDMDICDVLNGTPDEPVQP